MTKAFGDNYECRDTQQLDEAESWNSEYDPIIRDLRSRMLAEMEIKEIFNSQKPKVYQFKPSVIYNNFQPKM
jgi:hypothetical protein